MSVLEKLKPAKLPPNTFPLLIISGLIYSGIYWLWAHTWFAASDGVSFFPLPQIQVICNYIIEFSFLYVIWGWSHFAYSVAHRFKKLPEEIDSFNRVGRGYQRLENFFVRGAVYVGTYAILVWAFERGSIISQIALVLSIQYPLRRTWFYWNKFRSRVAASSFNGVRLPGFVGAFFVIGRGLRRVWKYLFAPSSPQPQRRRVE
jgi:hypothetical protein